jgi:hypothetical protein
MHYRHGVQRLFVSAPGVALGTAHTECAGRYPCVLLAVPGILFHFTGFRPAAAWLARRRGHNRRPSQADYSIAEHNRTRVPQGRISTCKDASNDPSGATLQRAGRNERQATAGNHHEPGKRTMLQVCLEGAAPASGRVMKSAIPPCNGWAEGQLRTDDIFEVEFVQMEFV